MTNGTERFISSHFRFRRVDSRILTLFDRYSGTPIYISKEDETLYIAQNYNHPSIAIMEWIYTVISLILNIMRTDLRYIDSNLFINF